MAVRRSGLAVPAHLRPDLRAGRSSGSSASNARPTADSRAWRARRRRGSRVGLAARPAARRPRTTTAAGRAPRAGRRRGRPTSRWVLRQAFESQPRADQRGDDLAERPRPGELPVLLAVGDRQAVDVLGRPAARRLDPTEVVVVGQRSSGRPRRRRTAIRPDGPRTGRTDPRARAAGRRPPPRRRGPAIQGSEPRPCRRGRRCRPGACGVASTSASIQRAGAPVASARRAASASIRGLKSIPTTSSAPEVPERQRVPAAGALEVDRPPAATVEVADELDLDAEQVDPAGPDERRRPLRTSPRSARRPRPRRPGSRRASGPRRPARPRWGSGRRDRQASRGA